ncbi:MAG: serine/threonine protein kinase [Deltaproteobacteria bacterium]|nr:serine/threonine protein kinase [Deltaproteobacteria bacterium]MDQ3297482.1 serine/threonine protein kinase [Myxococcota bacterium]
MEAPERYGPYLVYEQIGKGGMATVHRAELTTKKGIQQLALKRLFPTLQRELVALFLDEARLLKYLDHPNIAATYDSGRVFGTYFIAMEYVRGPTLKELVEHCRVTVGSVPQPVTLLLAAQLCDALDHAHNQRDEHGKPLDIIHRDVTPANLIVSETGQLKLIDFGLAKAKVTTEETAQGVIKGKYGYIAPEYIGGKLDHRADLWAVGIIMYELLTSRRLFDGHDAFETVKRVREMPIPRPSIGNPKVTPELDEIVMTALERDPRRRWQSAGAMRDRIRALSAQPGNAMTEQGISAWVAWVFEQKRGRVPQLTPMMPMPIRTPQGIPVQSGESLVETAPVRTAFAWTPPNIAWVAGAALVLVLFVVGVIGKLAG